jgi:hypothetical protein
MSQIDCPKCKAGMDVPDEETYFGNRILCAQCRTQLEVVNEHPLRVVESNRGRGGWISDWLSRSSSETLDSRRES